VPARARTTLNLLTREGALCVTFSPALEARQYDALLEVVDDADTLKVLTERVMLIAQHWKREVVIDSV